MIVYNQYEFLITILLIIFHNINMKTNSNTEKEIDEKSFGEKLSNNYKLKSVKKILSPQNVAEVQSGSLSHLLEQKRYIKEVFFFEKEKKIRMAIIIDEKRTRLSSPKNINISSQLTHQVCLRLMVESVLLIENLHFVGLSLNEPLQHFLQIQKSSGPAEQYCLSMINFTSKKQSISRANIFSNSNSQSSQLISKGQILLLQQFLFLLLKEKSRHSGLKTFQKILDYLHSLSAMNLAKLKSKILQIHVQSKKNFLQISGCYDLDNKKLEMKIGDQKRGYMFYSNVHLVQQMKEGLQLSTEEYFYILATLEEGRVDRPSFNELIFLGENGAAIIKVFLIDDKLELRDRIQQTQKEKEDQQFQTFRPIKKQREQHFPYNCIGIVKSTFILANKPQQIFGVGSLIESDLVLTCAQLVAWKFNCLGDTRSTPKKVHFVLGEQQFEADQWKFPNEFLDHKLSKLYDFALLRLKKPIERKLYLSIAQNYSNTNKVTLITFKHEQKESFLDKETTDQPLSISNQYQVMEHPFITEKGSSGSPLLVKFQEEQLQSYIISIHYKINSYGKGMSIKMREVVVKRLIEFEKEMKKKAFSWIKFDTVEYKQKQLIKQNKSLPMFKALERPVVPAVGTYDLDIREDKQPISIAYQKLNLNPDESLFGSDQQKKIRFLYYISKDKIDISTIQTPFQFTIKHVQGYDKQLKAILKIITPEQLQMIRNGKLSYYRIPQSFVKEVIFLQRGGRRYSLQVIDDEKINQGNQFMNVYISAAAGWKLLIETVLLIEGLHELGIKISQPLQNYLQFYNMKGSARDELISMIKFRAGENCSSLEITTETQATYNGGILNQKELVYLRDFLIHLMQSLTSRYQRLIFEFLMQDIEICLSRKKPFSLISLKKKLLTIKETNLKQKFILLGFYYWREQQLQVTIFKKDGSQSKCHWMKGFVLIQQVNQMIGPQELFYILVTRKEGDLRVLSLNEITFFWEKYSHWCKITFKQAQEKDEFELNEVSDQFPYNCIGQIQITIQVQGNKKQYREVGSLIANNLVLTSAHFILQLKNTYLSQDKKQTNSLSSKIQFVWNNQRIKVEEYKIYQSLLNQYNYNDHDYALIKLAKKIELTQYLSISSQFKMVDKLRFYQFYQQQIDQNIIVKRSKKLANLQPEKNMVKIKKIQGSTGSPMIAQFSGPGECYIIGVCSDDQKIYQNAIEMTRAVNQDMIYLQKTWLDRTFSWIQIGTIKFEYCLRQNSSLLKLLGVEKPKIAHFPQNCMGIVQSKVISHKKKITVSGIGCLVGPNLVLTCAFLIRPKIALDLSVRSTPYEINFIINEQSYQIIDYSFPEKYFVAQKEMSNNYALLLLGKSIELKSYMPIAINYQSKSKLSLISFEYGRNGNIKKEQILDEPQKVSNESAIIRHNFKTRNGDSGSPILVKFYEESWQQHIVAIHIGSDNILLKKGVSVKITEEVVQYLIGSEQKMKNSELSLIKLSSAKFERSIQQLKIADQEQQKFMSECTDQQIIYLKKTKEIWDMLEDLPVAFIPSYITKRNLSQKFNQLQMKYYSLLDKYPLYTFGGLQTTSQNQQKLILIKQLTDFKVKFQQKISKQEIMTYLTRIDKMLMLLQKGQTHNNNQKEDFKQFISHLKQNQNLFQIFRADCMELALHMKVNHFQLYKEEEIFFCKEISTLKLSTAMKTLEKQLFHTNFGQSKSLLFNALMMDQRANSFQLHPIELQQQFPLHFISPFTDFRCNGYYQFGMTKYYQFELQIQFSEQQHLDEFMWQQVEFIHQNYSLCYTKPVISENRIPTLRFRFRTPFNFTLMDLRKKIIKQQNTKDLLTIAEKIIDFVCILHLEGFHLCTPIEYCLLADSSRKTTIFFFFGHHQALFHKVSKLKQRFHQNIKKMKKVLEYYPVEEILNSKGNKAAFDNIDVWMLGKSFQRLLLSDSQLKNSQFESQIRKYIQIMTNTDATCRPTMKQVRENFKQMVPFLKF